MKIAIYPGSFDPITLGHLDIIRRAAACFDKVYVCVMVNCEKKNPMFTDRERLEQIRQSVEELPNVEAELWTGLLADYAGEKGATILVKGLRTSALYVGLPAMHRLPATRKRVSRVVNA